MTRNPHLIPSFDGLLHLVVVICRLNISSDEAVNKTLTGLSLDSLELMNLAIELEDRYGLELDLIDLSSDSTLGELLEKILAQINQISR
jgi:acyl carrier protein